MNDFLRDGVTDIYFIFIKVCKKKYLKKYPPREIVSSISVAAFPDWGDKVNPKPESTISPSQGL